MDALYRQLTKTPIDPNFMNVDEMAHLMTLMQAVMQ